MVLFILLVLEILLVGLLYYFVEPFKTKLKQHKLLFINAQIFFMAMLGLALQRGDASQSLLYDTVAFMFGNYGTSEGHFNGLLAG